MPIIDIYTANILESQRHQIKNKKQSLIKTKDKTSLSQAF